MKKTYYITIIAVVLAAVCLVCPSCRNKEEMDYLPVYGYDDTLSASDSIFLKSCFSGFGPRVEDKNPADMPSRKEVIFGKEVELFYEDTAVVIGTPLDFYRSLDNNYSIGYDVYYGNIRSLIDHNRWKLLGQKETAPCADEELIRIATKFAEEKWPILRDNNYSAKVFKHATGEHNEVTLIRCVNGYSTTEYVRVLISQTGEIAGWGDYLKYPDGVPEKIVSAIETMDMELCEKSVVHYIDECIREASERGIQVEGIRRIWIEFVRDGRVFIGMYPELTKNGEKYEITSRFFVPVPYDGQPTVEDEKATTEKPDALPVVTEEDHVTSVLTETAVTQPETTENLETIPAEEAIE